MGMKVGQGGPTMFKRLITLCAVAVYVAVLAGCHTTEGVGKDVEAAGEGIQDLSTPD